MKKAQLQIKESVFVIFIFVIIFIVGFMFFYNYTLQSIKKDINDYEDFKFKQLLSIVPNMAELRCSSLGVGTECINLGNVIGFRDVSSGYFKEFGWKKIELELVYPEGSSYVIYEKIPNRYGSIKKISTPVSVYHPKYDNFFVGVLRVEAYIK